MNKCKSATTVDISRSKQKFVCRLKKTYSNHGQYNKNKTFDLDLLRDCGVSLGKITILIEKVNVDT